MSGMHGGCWGSPRGSNRSRPLTLLGTRSKDPETAAAAAWPPRSVGEPNPGPDVAEIRRPADFAGSSDLSLATRLGPVDPPPRRRGVAEHRHGGTRLVARSRRFGPRNL